MEKQNTVTEKEYQILNAIAHSEYIGGTSRVAVVNTAVWTQYLQEDSGISASSMGGVVASLVKKKLVSENGESGKHAAIYMTSEGFNIWQEHIACADCGRVVLLSEATDEEILTAVCPECTKPKPCVLRLGVAKRKEDGLFYVVELKEGAPGLEVASVQSECGFDTAQHAWGDLYNHLTCETMPPWFTQIHIWTVKTVFEFDR